MLRTYLSCFDDCLVSFGLFSLNQSLLVGYRLASHSQENKPIKQTHSKEKKRIN